MNDVYENHKIELLTDAEIANINGTAGHFNVDVKIKPQSVSDRCTSCGSVRPFVQSKCQIGGTPTHEQEKLSTSLFHRPNRIGIRSMQSTASIVVSALRRASPTQLSSKPNLLLGK